MYGDLPLSKTAAMMATMQQQQPKMGPPPSPPPSNLIVVSCQASETLPQRSRGFLSLPHPKFLLKVKTKEEEDAEGEAGTRGNTVQRVHQEKEKKKKRRLSFSNLSGKKQAEEAAAEQRRKDSLEIRRLDAPLSPTFLSPSSSPPPSHRPCSCSSFSSPPASAVRSLSSSVRSSSSPPCSSSATCSCSSSPSAVASSPSTSSPKPSLCCVEEGEKQEGEEEREEEGEETKPGMLGCLPSKERGGGEEAEEEEGHKANEREEEGGKRDKIDKRLQYANAIRQRHEVLKTLRELRKHLKHQRKTDGAEEKNRAETEDREADEAEGEQKKVGEESDWEKDVPSPPNTPILSAASLHHPSKQKEREGKEEKAKGEEGQGKKIMPAGLLAIANKQRKPKPKRVFPLYLLDEVMSYLQTGDIVLLHGTETISRVIEVGTWSFFSHVALLIRHPSEEVKRLYDVEVYRDRGREFGIPENAMDEDDMYLFESDTETLDSREGGGVQLVPLRFWMHDTADYYGFNPVMVIRRLYLPNRSGDNDVDFPGLEPFLRSAARTLYKWDKKAMLGSVFAGNKVEKLETMFCSEAVAAALRSMGLMGHRVSSNYLPKDFASKRVGVRHKHGVRLLRNAIFEAEFAVAKDYSKARTKTKADKAKEQRKLEQIKYKKDQKQLKQQLLLLQKERTKEEKEEQREDEENAASEKNETRMKRTDNKLEERN